MLTVEQHVACQQKAHFPKARATVSQCWVAGRGLIVVRAIGGDVQAMAHSESEANERCACCSSPSSGCIRLHDS